MKPISRRQKVGGSNVVKLAPLDTASTNSAQTSNGGDGQLMDVIQEWMGKLKDAGRNGQLAPLISADVPSSSIRHSATALDESKLTKRHVIQNSPIKGDRPALDESKLTKRHVIQNSPIKGDRPVRSLRKSGDLKSVASSACSSVNGSLAASAASVYSQSIVVDGIPANKINSLLLQLGRAVHELSDVDAIYDISTRGRIDNLLGPLELQARLLSLFQIRWSSHEIQLLMKRFGTSGVSHDRVDLNELLAWARSAFERNQEKINFEINKKKTRREVKELMARNGVISKLERNKQLEAEFQKKIELKLSLAALSILEGNDKSANILETADSFVNAAEFKDILNQMGVFLSNLEYNCLVNAFIIDYASPGGHYHQHKTKWNANSNVSTNSPLTGAEIVSFDGFRGYMLNLMRESANMARQGKAVDEFKQALSKGKPPDTHLLQRQNSGSSSSSLGRGVSGTISEVSEEDNYENETFESSGEATALRASILNTEKALEDRDKQKNYIGRSNNAHKPQEKRLNSIRLLYDDSLSIQDINKDVSIWDVSEGLTKSAAVIDNTGSQPRPTVQSVLTWLSDPLEAANGAHKK